MPTLKVVNIIFAFFVLSTFISTEHLSAQNNSPDVIQFTGIIVNAENLHPIPYTHVTVKHYSIGTISDYYGFFSFVARPNDTIQFSCLGYQKSTYIIPDDLDGDSYSILHKMEKDTIALDEVNIYPWPSREQFKQAFLQLELEDNDLIRAKRNLAPEVLRQLAADIPASGSEAYKYELQQRYTRLYYAGGYPSLSLLNPLAWAKFIQAWKRGDYKRKKDK